MFIRNDRVCEITDRFIDTENAFCVVVISTWENELLKSLRAEPTKYLYKLEAEWSEEIQQSLEILVGEVWEPYSDELFASMQIPVLPFDLGAAQTKKSLELNLACQTNIYNGYDSLALGTVHHYPARDKDQANMVASVTNALYPDLPSDWTTAFWCADSEGVWEYREHTAAQIRQAGADGKESISASLLKNSMLQAQVQALPETATQADLDAIVW